jgi:hypothetical protein
MKRTLCIAGTLTLLTFLGCAPQNDKPAAETKAVEATKGPEPSPKSDDSLPTSYMDAATALSVDDFDKAKVSLTALAKETTGEFQKKAQVTADAADIAAMRESFRELSALAAGMKLPDEYAVAYCPMYKGGSKWVQKKDKLANPYYGKSMQTCGTFVN